jgi:hypothetical protein
MADNQSKLCTRSARQNGVARDSDLTSHLYSVGSNCFVRLSVLLNPA